MMALIDLDSRTLDIGRELLAEVRERRTEWFSRRFWSDRLMQRAMRDDAFKVQLFRFVDAFPALRSPAAVYDCLVEYLTQPGVTLPPGMDLGLKAGGLAKGLLTKTTGRWIAAIAGNFIAGGDAASALPQAARTLGAGRRLHRRPARRGLRQPEGSRSLSAALPRPGPRPVRRPCGSGRQTPCWNPTISDRSRG